MIQVIGAGLGRTGTNSLQLALQRLLHGKCYHMFELRNRPEDVAVWKEAACGKFPEWEIFLSGWSAVVDWPAAAYWRELSEVFPKALVILSTRDPESWWQSVSDTIFPALANAKKNPWRDMVMATFENRFTTEINNKERCVEAFNEHNRMVKQRLDKDGLLEWHPKDGWDPICKALNLPIPVDPFPHVNSREEFTIRINSKDS